MATVEKRKWKKLRRAMNPTFHPKIIEDFQVVLNEKSAVLVQLLKKEVENSDCSYFDILPYFNRLTVDTSLGTKNQ